MEYRRTWMEIDGEALKRNTQAVRGLLAKETKLCACVKANAWGHDLVQASQVLDGCGVDLLAVDAVFEARLLREAGITAPIYIMGYVAPGEFEEVARLGCEVVLYDIAAVEKFDAAGKKHNFVVPVHIKVETGMNRQGVHINDVVDLGRAAHSATHVSVEGLCSHFAEAKNPDKKDFMNEQYQGLMQAKNRLAEIGIYPPCIHIANSAAALMTPEYHLDMVRIGMLLYGMWPAASVRKYMQEHSPDFNLEPIATWKTRVAQVRSAEAGTTVGYNRTHKLEKDSVVAVVPVGYFDGYNMALSNNGYALVRGMRARIVGTICMNMFMLDVSDIPDVCVDDEVVLMGPQGSERITAEEIASWAKTITYTTTSRVATGSNTGIPRIYV